MNYHVKKDVHTRTLQINFIDIVGELAVGLREGEPSLLIKEVLLPYAIANDKYFDLNSVAF
jgi:hypothetical protein